MLTARALSAILIAALQLATAHAATGLSAIRYIPDITVDLGGQTIGPNQVAQDSFGGAPTIAVPAQPADLAAYYRLPTGFLGPQVWLVFKTTTLLPGGLTATPRDVVSYDPVLGYAIKLDGAATGIPASAAIDALSSTNGVDVLLSFETTTTVGGVTADPRDVVRYAGGWTSYFVGSAVPAGANLDALHYLGNGHLLMSFDTAGTIGGVSFTAGDVIEYTPSGPLWEVAFSPASIYPGWGAANLHGLWAQEAAANPGTLQFSAPTYTVSESGLLATITVTRTGGTTGVVSVQYATADGTAGATDYATASGTLTWANGDPLAKTFTVAVTSDAVPEGAETVLLALSNPTGGAVLGSAAATLIIVDDDLPPGTPMMAATPQTLDFGNQALGTTSGLRTVVVTSAGNAALVIGTITLGGADAGDFAVVADTCSGATLAPLANCSLSLGFTPTAQGGRAAALAIASNDPATPSATVDLAGTGSFAPLGATVTGIPTLSVWGLIALNLLVAAAIGMALSRKETT